MAYTFWLKLTNEPTSIQTYSTGGYLLVGLDNGQVRKLTVSDKTNASLASFVGRKITAICSDGTSLYVGFSDGSLEKVTIANGAITTLEPKAKHRFGIVAIHYYTTTLYITGNDGKIYTRATT